MVESLTTQIEDMVTLYREKNPNFNGKIAFIGHGISSLILFDILSNQNTPNPNININKPIENEPKSVSEAGFRKLSKNHVFEEVLICVGFRQLKVPLVIKISKI